MVQWLSYYLIDSEDGKGSWEVLLDGGQGSEAHKKLEKEYGSSKVHYQGLYAVGHVQRRTTFEKFLNTLRRKKKSS